MLPTFDLFIHPVLEFLGDGKEHNMNSLRRGMINYFNLTNEDISIRTAKGQQTQLYNRVQWATTYLKKAGLITKPKYGINLITKEGKDVLHSGKRVTPDFLRQYSPEFLEFSTGTKRNGGSTSSELEGVAEKETPEDAIEKSCRIINHNLAEELLEKVKQISPRRFEELVVELLGKMGYGDEIENSGHVTQYSKDGGIDGIIKGDKLGLDSIYIQAKRWSSTVGVEQIRSFVGALDEYGGNKGVFITTSCYSADARNYTSKNKKIVLIDGMQLCQYMIECNLGVFVKETYELKKIDMDFFQEE